MIVQDKKSNLQKALHMAMFSIREINGTTINPDPRLEIISDKLSSTPVADSLADILKGGG